MTNQNELLTEKEVQREYKINIRTFSYLSQNNLDVFRIFQVKIVSTILYIAYIPSTFMKGNYFLCL